MNGVAPAGPVSPSSNPEPSDSELPSIPVPAPDAPWSLIAEFALTYNAYERQPGDEEVADAANRAMDAWHERGILPDSLDECRAALFFEQRRWRHFDQEPHGTAPAYISALVRRIGELSDGSVPGPPDTGFWTSPRRR